MKVITIMIIKVIATITRQLVLMIKIRKTQIVKRIRKTQKQHYNQYHHLHLHQMQ